MPKITDVRTALVRVPLDTPTSFSTRQRAGARVRAGPGRGRRRPYRHRLHLRRQQRRQRHDQGGALPAAPAADRRGPVPGRGAVGGDVPRIAAARAAPARSCGRSARSTSRSGTATRAPAACRSTSCSAATPRTASAPMPAAATISTARRRRCWAKSWRASAPWASAAVKMKVGRLGLAEEEARIATARDAIGSADLMLDCNNGWRDLQTALRYMAVFEPYSPYWIEEPFLPGRPRQPRAAGAADAGAGRHRRDRVRALALPADHGQAARR